MPKNKRSKEEESNSDSDSGPEDRNESKAKKSKVSTSKRLKNEEGESFFELDKYKRVTVRSFRGKTLIDIREFYENNSTGKTCPGKKGISLNPALWSTLKSLMGEIDQAVCEM